MALDFVQNPPLKVTLATSSSRLITSPVIFNRTIGEIYGMLSGKDPARRNDARHIYEALECRLPSRLTVPSARDSGAPVARGAQPRGMALGRGGGVFSFAHPVPL